MSDMKSIAQHGLESAKKHGAQNASVMLSQRQRMSISCRNGKIEDIDSAGSSSFTIRLFVDGRYSSFKSSDLRHDKLDEDIHQAIEMTRLLESDPARKLPDPSMYENRADLDLELYDSAVASLTPNDLIEKCKILEAECKKFSDINIFDIGTTSQSNINNLYMVNTNGFEGSAQTSSCYTGCNVAVKEGEKNITGYHGHMTRFYSDLHSAEKIAADAVQNCRYRIGSQKIASGNRTIILDRNVSYFLYYFLRPLSGYSLVDKESYFMDKLGQQIGSGLLDVHNMPFIKRGLGSQLFDEEGISEREAVLFDHGVLAEIPLDTYCANKLNMKSTPDMSNVVLTPGKRSREEMIADVQDGIYVIDIMGGNSDRSRGDFSHGICGVAIENGKLTQNVSEMNITGNHLELWKNLTEVGNDLCENSNFVMPTLRFDNVSTSGS